MIMHLSSNVRFFSSLQPVLMAVKNGIAPSASHICSLS